MEDQSLEPLKSEEMESGDLTEMKEEYANVKDDTKFDLTIVKTEYDSEEHVMDQVDSVMFGDEEDVTKCIQFYDLTGSTSNVKCVGLSQVKSEGDFVQESIKLGKFTTRETEYDITIDYDNINGIKIEDDEGIDNHNSQRDAEGFQVDSDKEEKRSNIDFFEIFGVKTEDNEIPARGALKRKESEDAVTDVQCKLKRSNLVASLTGEFSSTKKSVENDQGKSAEHDVWGPHDGCALQKKKKLVPSPYGNISKKFISELESSQFVIRTVLYFNEQLGKVSYRKIKVPHSRKDGCVAEEQKSETLHTAENPELCTAEKLKILHTAEKPEILITGETSKILETLEKPKILRAGNEPKILNRAEQPEILDTADIPEIHYSAEIPEIVNTAGKPEFLDTAEKYICRWCTFSSWTFSQYRSHITVHTGQRRHACDSCEYSTNSTNALSRHRCPSKPFNDDSSFKERRAEKRLKILKRRGDACVVHNGERPFPCDLCDYKSRTPSELLEHQRESHENPTTTITSPTIVKP